MSGPVRRTTLADQQWADLAAQLTPAASLARIDAVTARATSTVTVLGVLITGLGALAAGQVALGGAARGLAVAAVITATVAVACALTAQVLTITRRLNPANLAEVRAWYQRQVPAPRLGHPGRHHLADPRRPAGRRHRDHHPANQPPVTLER